MLEIGTPEKLDADGLKMAHLAENIPYLSRMKADAFEIDFLQSEQPAVRNVCVMCQ